MEKYSSIPTGPIFTGGPCRGLVHVIEKGDSLYLLGKKYHVSVSKIMFANPYVNAYNLQIGDELCIPVSAGGGVEVVPLPQPLPEQPSGGKPMPLPMPTPPMPTPTPLPMPVAPTPTPLPMPMPPAPTPLPMPTSPPVPISRSSSNGMKQAPSPMPIPVPISQPSSGGMKQVQPSMPVMPSMPVPITPQPWKEMPPSYGRAQASIPLSRQENKGECWNTKKPSFPSAPMCCNRERSISGEMDPAVEYRAMQPGFRERGRENDREWNRYRNDRMDYRRRKNDGEYEIVPILSEDYD